MISLRCILILLTSCVLLGSCGGGGGSGGSTPSSSGPVQAGPPPAAALNSYAGNYGGSGYLNGSGSIARFNGPKGIAVDGAGNTFLADAGNYVIRKVSPSGQVSLFAGIPGKSGITDGPGVTAQFAFPLKIVIDSAGNLFVLDGSYDGTVRKITPTGDVSTFAGSPGQVGYLDGNGMQARFRGALDLTIDNGDNLYVADAGNQVVRKITSQGVVTTLAGIAGQASAVDGSIAMATFSGPSALTCDHAGNVYVFDSNDTVRVISVTGNVTTIAGTAGQSGFTNGSGSSALLTFPAGMASDPNGNLYLSDGCSAIRKISAGGLVSQFAGTSGICSPTGGQERDGLLSSALFYGPGGLAFDTLGNLYVSEDPAQTLRKISTQGIVTTLAGQGLQFGSTDGPIAAASFNGPRGMYADPSGVLYLADYDNDTVRKISGGTVVSTVAGIPGTAGVADGDITTATLSHPQAVARDSAGNIYVSDSGSHTIRKIDGSNHVSTLAGMPGQAGAADGISTSARFDQPTGIACDSAGNIFVADYNNHAIRKITPSGSVTTFAGQLGNGGITDGTGGNATLFNPYGLYIDSSDTLFVTDAFTNTVRKITPSGTVTTIAGTAYIPGTPKIPGSADGQGTASQFNQPLGIAGDSGGNLYVADYGNSTIRKISASGFVSTIVGTVGSSGFVPGALPGVLASPISVAVSGTTLYIATGNGVATVTNRP